MTLNTKIDGFMDFLAILGCKTLFKSELRWNQLRSTDRICLVVNAGDGSGWQRSIIYPGAMLRWLLNTRTYSQI